jgi:hypothetical protein
VRVFGEKQEGTPPQLTVAEGNVEEHGDHTDGPFLKAWQQVQAAGLLPPGSEQREAAPGDETEAARRLRAIFRPAKERGEGIPTPESPGDDPGQQSEERGGAPGSSR